MSLDKYASAGEAKMVRRLVSQIIKSGYTISIDDGEEIVVKKSKDKREIYPNMVTTGEDRLLIHDADGKHVGTFWLVYGNAANGEELIADYSANPICDELARYFDEGVK